MVDTVAWRYNLKYLTSIPILQKWEWVNRKKFISRRKITDLSTQMTTCYSDKNRLTWSKYFCLRQKIRLRNGSGIGSIFQIKLRRLWIVFQFPKQTKKETTKLWNLLRSRKNEHNQSRSTKSGRHGSMKLYGGQSRTASRIHDITHGPVESRAYTKHSFSFMPCS